MSSSQNKPLPPAQEHISAFCDQLPALQWKFSLTAALLLMTPFDLLASLGMDIYLPVVPHMASALQTSPDIIQLTLSLYMAVLGVGQLLLGPLSDKIGRKPVLLIGALLFTLASVGLAVTNSASVFLGLRVLQSAGGAAVLVATFATIRDVYAERPESVVIYSLFGSMLAFVPALAPLAGALLESWLGWRSIFWLLAGLAALAGLHAAWRWPETNPDIIYPPTPKPNAQAQQQGKLRSILTNRQFWTYTTGFSAALGSFFVYFSTAPRLLIGNLEVSPVAFSLWFATVAVIMVIASRFARFYTQWWGLRGTLRRGMLLVVFGGIVLLALPLITPPSVATLILPMWIVAAGISLTCSVSANGALQSFGDYAGTATAIYYCIESLIVSVFGTAAVILLGGDTILPLAVFCIVSALLTLGLTLRSSR